MKKLSWLAALTLALACCLPVSPEGPRFYLRNREVSGRVVGSDIFLARDQLERLLSADELGRIRWNAGGEPEIDGQLAPPGPGLSLSWLATQLGFVRRQGEGTVDWVKLPAAAASAMAEVSDESWKRRPEFREAGRRLDQVLQEIPRTDRVALQARVDRIGQQVVKASPLRGMKWTFVVVTMPSPNAACTGEGHVFVTDSLLDMGITDDELAGVLGHEVAHGVRRHVFRRSDLLRDIMLLLRDYEKLQARIDKGENTLTLREQVDRYSRQRDQLQYKFDHERFYSHVDEEEADVLGLRYAVTAGFSADGLGECLGRLEKLRISQFGTAVLKDDMSHPPTARRLEILQRARQNAGF
ncbi:M48 family metalloprotease [bacterium]|nr:M48 family metalloprotease [bacterium]